MAAPTFLYPELCRIVERAVHLTGKYPRMVYNVKQLRDAAVTPSSLVPRTRPMYCKIIPRLAQVVLDLVASIGFRIILIKDRK